MTLDAAAAARGALDAVESGSSAVMALVVGAVDPELLGRRFLLVRAPDGSETVEGGLGAEAVHTAALDAARSSLADPRGGDGLVTVGPDGATAEVYLEVRRPTRDLVIVGAGHIARPLSRVGAMLGYRVVVVDDRPAFATRERFPEAERLVRADFSDPFADVPLHGRSHVLLVTRGHKYDYECLVRLLRLDTPPMYLGMIGSRRRVRATFAQLLEEGFERRRLEDIHAPVGLDLGAETPEEIAVAVAAELVLLHRGGTGAPLREVERVAERFFPADGSGGPPDAAAPPENPSP